MAFAPPVVLGNWKMNGLRADGEARVKALLELWRAGPGDGTLGVCPPATLLVPLAAMLGDSGILLGAQDCASEPKGGFLRSNDPAGGRWYSRDVPAIAAARRVGQAAPFFIDADATPNPGGWPVGGLTVLRFNNNHLVYALTWFGLAGISLAALFLLLRRKPA